MTYENIKSTRSHFVAEPPYYYQFDHVLNNLNKRTSDGELCFTWPILGSITAKEVGYALYDGFFFWTLQRTSTTSATVKKFRLGDVVCTEVSSYLFDNTKQSLNTDFNVNAIFVESYNTTLSGTVPQNSCYVSLSEFSDRLVAGDTLYLGPNSDGDYEKLTVTGTITTESGTYVGFNFYTSYAYANGDPAYFAKRLGIFNANRGTTVGGALYTFNPETWEFKQRVDSDDYSNLMACDFCFYNNIPLIAYVKVTTLYMINMDLSLYTTMTLDNYTTALVPIMIYGISVHGNNVYRLQMSATYFGTTYSWTTYNIQMSTLIPFIDSTSIGAWPKILPSTGMSVSKVSLVAQDQFGQPLKMAQAFFTEDDSSGYMTLVESYTDTHGIAINYYKSGTIPRTVNITGAVMTVINL